MVTSPVPSDDSALSRTDQIFNRLESVLNLLGGLMILALVLLASANVLGRKLINLPLPGFIDWVQQAMAVIAFAGLAYCQRDGGHVRMDVVIRRFRRRSLWAAELFSTVVIWLVATVLIYGSWHHFLRSFDLSAPGWSRDSSIDIGLPLWPAKLVIPFALTILWLRLLLQIWGYWRAVRQDLSRPAGVPQLLDAAQLAAGETAVERRGDANA